MNRRRFFRSTTLAGAGLASWPAPAAPEAKVPAVDESRDSWIAMLLRVAEPVIANLAANKLKATMPVEAQRGAEEKRRLVTHLEALGRTLAGIAPWLELSLLDGVEERQRARFADLTRKALANAVDPDSADHLDFTVASQNLVDAAFLALGLSRARKKIWDRLDAAVRARLIAALQSTRKFKPGNNNWLLFSATIEAFLASVGAEWLPEPIDQAIASHEEWYKGDGMYGDGAEFHWDYYNSFVIQPMMLAVLEMMEPIDKRWSGHHPAVLKRAIRYAAEQERLIAPDGTYPPIGRSITYRCGAFHHLANMALRHQLPAGVTLAQVRGALSAVIRRTLGAPDTFDEGGWLRIGLAGHQPSLGEGYISTGSLYLCTFAFVPLGSPPADEFWRSAAVDRTSTRIWSGKDLHADHAS